jgi:hypothetical protein
MKLKIPQKSIHLMDFIDLFLLAAFEHIHLFYLILPLIKLLPTFCLKVGQKTLA